MVFLDFGVGCVASNRVLPEDYCKEDPCNIPWDGELAMIDQELTNFWATLCTISCPGDFVQFSSYQERVQNPAGKKLTKTWTWIANF